jgi:signal transduction histidine kinase
MSIPHSPEHHEAVIRHFTELTHAFDSLRHGGEQLSDLAKNLLSLAFRDIPYEIAGGLVVPQLGAKASQEISFLLQQNSTASHHWNDFEQQILNAWQIGRTAPFEMTLESCQKPLTFLFHPIASGFTRPIGYYWALIPNDFTKSAESRLGYVAKYLAIATRAEKASNALELLSGADTTTSSSINDIAASLSSACQKALSATTVVVWLPDPVKQRLRTVASADATTTSRLRVDMHFNQGIAGKCFSEGAPFIVDDLQNTAHLTDMQLIPFHTSLISTRGWRSAMFVPLGIGGTVAGVMSAYGPRPRGFSTIDQRILLAFAHRFSATLANIERMNHLTEMELRIEAEAPSIEAGMLAMENVHDAVNSLTVAQNSLTIVAQMISRERHGRLFDEVSNTLLNLRSAKKGIAALTRRARFTKLSPSRTDLKELTTEVIQRVTSEAANLKVKLRHSCPSNLILRVDREMLHRVLVNLLNNSLWFLEHDAKGVSHYVDLTVASRPDGTSIKVRDNGPGIAPYDVNRVFDYFFTTKGDRGMGFGLALAKRIIERHGGTISADSQWGYWTEITILLPTSLNA